MSWPVILSAKHELNHRIKQKIANPLLCPDDDYALLIEINHPPPLPNLVYSNFCAGEHFFPHPANLLKHFQADRRYRLV